jgi:hypothetical protein
VKLSNGWVVDADFGHWVVINTRSGNAINTQKGNA